MSEYYIILLMLTDKLFADIMWPSSVQLLLLVCLNSEETNYYQPTSAMYFQTFAYAFENCGRRDTCQGVQP
jgi:hypothetical protein